MVTAFHHESIARFRGAAGIRDDGLLESALARVLNRNAYDETATFFDLAGEYCAGIVLNHPFVDGNKGTGLLAGRVFLALNGYRFEPDEAVTVEMIRGLASGTIDPAVLTTWFADYSTRQR